MQKILAFTNARVKALNQASRKLIFGENFKNEFNLGEIITGYDNFQYDSFQFYNSFGLCY